MESTAFAGAPERAPQNMALRLEYGRKLPTLPTVAMRVLERAEDTAATLADFGDLIRQDPALAGKLLRVANSSFYARRCEVASIPQALRVLGLNATVALVLTFSLRGMPVAGAGTSFDPNDYWRHSILTGFAAQGAAAELGERYPEDFLLAGLLREIGALVLHASYGESYAAVCAGVASHADLAAQEHAAFGIDHVEAGTQVLQSWHLPPSIVDSMRLSHAPERRQTPVDQATERLAACVAGAARVVDAWLAGVSPDALVAETTAASAALGLSGGQLRKVVETMSRKVPEIEALFQVRISDPKVLDSFEEAAQELSLVRSVRQVATSPLTATRTRALEQQVAALEEQTQRDPLTGLYNRAHLDQVIEREFARAARELTPLSVAFIDLDHFKEINDTFGHPAGDQVLITTARRLEASLRQTDTVVRYGGEEFVVLLAGTRSQDAAIVVQRMLDAVGNPPFQTRDGASGTIAFSAGIATHMEGGYAFESARALIAAADHALYQAKRQGRGRIVVYDVRQGDA